MNELQFLLQELENHSDYIITVSQLKNIVNNAIIASIQYEENQNKLKREAFDDWNNT